MTGICEKILKTAMAFLGKRTLILAQSSEKNVLYQNRVKQILRGSTNQIFEWNVSTQGGKRIIPWQIRNCSVQRIFTRTVSLQSWDQTANQSALTKQKTHKNASCLTTTTAIAISILLLTRKWTWAAYISRIPFPRPLGMRATEVSQPLIPIAWLLTRTPASVVWRWK